MNKPELLFNNKPLVARDIHKIFCIKGYSGECLTESVPYSGADITCGIENEFQTAVSGRSSDVDLPLYISESNYLKNLILLILLVNIRELP